MGLLAKAWSTFGNEDRMRVPRPAANTITSSIDIYSSEHAGEHVIAVWQELGEIGLRKNNRQT
jgi:hypothetical protein